MRLFLNFHLLALSIICLWALKLKEFWRIIVEWADIFYVFLFPWLFLRAWKDRYFLAGFIYLSNWRLYIRNYKYCPAIFLWLFLPSASFWHSESVDNIKQMTGIYVFLTRRTEACIFLALPAFFAGCTPFIYRASWNYQKCIQKPVSQRCQFPHRKPWQFSLVVIKNSNFFPLKSVNHLAAFPVYIF